MASFKPDYVFSKGIGYGEFFDPATDKLVGFSEYITDFGLNGSLNTGDVEGGPGNMLIMCIPDTARLAVTAKTADAMLNNMAMTVGAELHGNGIIETVTGVVASGNTLSLTGAVAPPGGANGPVAYVITSSGADKAAVEAASGTAYPVKDGVITGFNAVSGNTYCVKYFIKSSSAEQLDIPALFAPKVVRAHFAVYCYAKKTGGDTMASSLYKIRHYYFPYYFFTAGLQDSVGQTSNGSVDLSGNCLTYEDAMSSGQCAATGNQRYGFIVDEFVGGESSTAAVDGIYFIGLGDGVSLAKGATLTLPVKYSVNGALTDISDMAQVTFTSAAAGTAKFDDSHENVVTGVAAGSTMVTATVLNSRTGASYSDSIAVEVTA